MIAAVIVTVLIASVFAAGFVVALRDSDRWCREEELDELWDDAA